jgi:hypothetical protein
MMATAPTNSLSKLAPPPAGGNDGSTGGGLVLGPPVPDLQYLVGKSPASSALGFVIRGTKYVSETQSPQ